MQLSEYQERAMSTCMPTSKNPSYMLLNLMGEMGEIASKIGKAIRKGWVEIDGNKIINKGMTEGDFFGFLDALKLEVGDVLWQTAGTCASFGWDLEQIAQMNLDKLSARKTNGTIDGSGDGVTKEERR